jgi:hypothetical protein
LNYVETKLAKLPMTPTIYRRERVKASLFVLKF